MTIIRGACPHDCPDTCAMLTTVENGRAVAIAGDPEHPITDGFLCGKVSNYLDRVYAADRVLRPLVHGRETTWDEALDVAAAGIRAALEAGGGEAVLPFSYMGTQGAIQGGSIAHRFMNAIGACELVRTVCATAGMVGTVQTHGISPEVDPDEWHHARFLLLWGWNPMSTAPHLWKRLLAARRAGAKLVVVDPFRSRTARVADEHLRPLPGTDAALALGMMRAIFDAGLSDEQWCRAHADGYDELVARVRERSVAEWAAQSGVDAAAVERVARELATTQPALLRLGVGAQRHYGAPPAYATIASLAALTGAWRHRGGGCSYIPTATAGAVSSWGLTGPELRTAPSRSINMSQLGDALTSLDPPIRALVVWSSNPAQIAPDQARVLAGLRREDLFTVVIEQFMTDTARHADVVLPATTQLEHLDAVFSWGHHYFTLNEPAIEPVGEAKPTTEAFRLLAARMGLDDPLFSETDEQLLERLLADGPVSLRELRARGWQKIDLGQGPTPHAEGGFGTATGRLALSAHYEPPAEAGRGLSLITPKTHLFLNSTFPNQARQHHAQPEPFVVVHPDDAAEHGVDDGGLARVSNDRGAFVCRARVSEDTRRGVLVAPMGWWSEDYVDGVSAQATTSQRLTLTGEAPTFNDNRVDIGPAGAP